jgi:hypothetical protein
LCVNIDGSVQGNLGASEESQAQRSQRERDVPVNQESAMRSKLQQLSLIALGICVGVMISLNFSAVAQRDVLRPLPVEELRAFTEVFGRIKADYVEPVEDKKLITEAITGMLAGLDPHSAYLSLFSDRLFARVARGHQVRRFDRQA